jgi:CubicO group peptidase (beta-lactamase class C family)
MTPAAEGADLPEQLRGIVAQARRDIDKGWLPACQLAVAREGELLVFETLGDATNDTRFCIFSATKPIVAAAVWQLIADGLLEVERPVADYIPEFADSDKSAVSVEHVLLHTAGFPNAPMSPEEGADPDARSRRFASWRLDFEPGTRFEYHAVSAHWVLIDLLERLGHQDYRDFIDARVTAPLGLPRLLGIPPEHQPSIAPITWVGEGVGTAGAGDLSYRWDDPDLVAIGAPGAGGVATAADIALFYQGLLHNPGKVWDPVILEDAKTHIRCTLPDPRMGIPVNRTLGLVVAGDDGMHTLRYGAFAEANSPGSFGHAGAHVQVAWADPETGVSFAYFTNGLDTNTMKEGVRGLRLSNLAAALYR